LALTVKPPVKNRARLALMIKKIQRKLVFAREVAGKYHHRAPMNLLGASKMWA